jgi:hypothetical protein
MTYRYFLGHACYINDFKAVPVLFVLKHPLFFFTIVFDSGYGSAFD